MTQVRQQTWNRELYGIVNAHGDPWTYRVFGSKEEAQLYLDIEAAQPPKLDLSKHRVAPASITVRIVGSRK